MRRWIEALARARSASGDLALVAVCLVLLPGVAITALALVEAALLEPPRGVIFALFLLPLGGAVVAGGVLLLYAAREQGHLARNQAAFVAQRAHDIRTPLATLRMVLAGAADSGDGGEREAGRAALEVLEREVGELLDWGRLAAGRASYRLRPLPIRRVIEAALLRTRGVVAARRQRVAVAGDPGEAEVLGDEDGLTAALTNLLANASKFSPAGSTIELEVRLAAGVARVSVSDRGPGVPPAERVRIFRMFYRGRGTGDREGVGLGLAIVEQVVRAHGGRVWVEDREGGGATFTVVLPLRETLEGSR